MARNYQKAQYNNQFQPQAQSRGLQPVTAVDRSKQIAVAEQRKMNDLKTQETVQNRQHKLDQGVLNAQHTIQKAQMQGQNAMIDGIIKLSGTALKGFELAQEHEQKMTEINENMDIIFGDGVDPGISSEDAPAVVENAADGVQQEQQQTAQDTATENAVREVAPDMPVVQEEVRQESANASADRARSRMGAREFALNLPALVITELEQGPPPSSPSELMERTRQIVARLAQENGVRGFSADQLSTVARAVGATMQQVNSQYLPGVIAAEQETRIEAHQQDFNSAWELDQANGVGSANIQAGYAALAAGFYNSGKYDTQGQANEAALQYMMQYLQNSKDIDGLEALKGVLTNGQKGTEAWKKYGADIDRAISNVRSGRKADQTAAQEQLQDTMYERLAGAQGTAEREAIVAETVAGLRAQGLYEEARALEEEMDELRIPGTQGLNIDKTKEAIIRGEVTDQQTIDDMLARGTIDASGHETLTSFLAGRNNSNPSDDPRISGIQSALTGRLTDALGDTLGLGRGSTGELVPGESDNLRPGDWAVISQQIETDANTFVNTLLAQDPDLAKNPAELQRRVNDWFREQTSAGGKYDLTGFDSSDPKVVEKAKSRFPNLVDDPTRLAQIRGSVFAGPKGSRGTVEPIDFSGFQLQTDGKPHPYVIQHFNQLRGDKVYDSKTIMDMGADFERGVIDPRLVATAQSLNMTPSQLLQQQAAAYGMGRFVYNPSNFQRASASGQIVDTSAPPTAVEGAQMLMAKGLPAKGAAWLSGNIQQESSWQGQRSWGGVYNPSTGAMDGTSRNGGLVSWASWSDNPARLGVIEARLGKPIDQASDAEQIDAMLWEMETNYPEAYRIFMSPYSSDRDLIRASKQYWGYGHEGSRYSYARDVERQLS